MDTFKQMYLKLYNTETKEKEKIVPSDHESMRMYTCGPRSITMPISGILEPTFLKTFFEEA